MSSSTLLGVVLSDDKEYSYGCHQTMKNTHYSTSTLALSLPSIAVPILASLSHPSCPAGQGLTGWKAFQIGHVTPFQRATSPFTRAIGWQANWTPRQQQQAPGLSSEVCRIIPYFLSLAYPFFFQMSSMGRTPTLHRHHAHPLWRRFSCPGIAVCQWRFSPSRQIALNLVSTPAVSLMIIILHTLPCSDAIQQDILISSGVWDSIFLYSSSALLLMYTEAENWFSLMN